MVPQELPREAGFLYSGSLIAACFAVFPECIPTSETDCKVTIKVTIPARILQE